MRLQPSTFTENLPTNPKSVQTEHIPLDETHCFSSFFLDYINQNPELVSFYETFPKLENFQDVIIHRKFNDSNRSVLAESLEKQYEGLEITKEVSSNIEKLKDSKTFTITTGHQLNIFTGPLYFLYKIVTVTNACKELKKKYPEHEFVPVYWMASEDHDFDEINHFYFEGKRFQWDTDQTGAVGRFNPNGLADLCDKLPNKGTFFKDAYSQESLASAARYYVNYLFGAEGVIVIDADHTSLKKLFTKVIEDDLFNHSANELVNEANARLEQLGFKPQVNSREINFFYLDDGVRERIERSGDQFQVLNNDISFSSAEIKKLIQSNPEKFSPNVILRPLYQETILPNLAYVGGPSEMVYWLQLKSTFEHYKTSFPILLPRNFATILTEKDRTKWAKTELSNGDLFLGHEGAFNKWVQANTSDVISYADELAKLEEIYQAIGQKAAKVDPTLEQHVEALKAVSEKRVQLAEKKLLRAEKKKHAEKSKQISDVIEALFPNGSPQERRDNFLNFYLRDPQFVQHLLDTFDPFDFRMYLLFE